MKKVTIILIFLALCSKFLGLLRDIIMANFYGTSIVTDAYVIATTITTVVMGFIGAAISTTFIPTVTRISNDSNQYEVHKFVSNLINVLLFIGFVIIIIVIGNTEKIVALFASGFKEDSFKITVDFTKITIFSILFLMLVSIYKPYIQIYGKVWIVGLIGFPLNIILILSVTISYYFDNIYFLAYGIVLAYIGQAIILLPFVKKGNFKYIGYFNLNDPTLKKILLLTLPVILGVSVNQINTIVSRTLASQVTEGAVSAIDYASKVNGLIEGIFVTSLITALFPRMVKSANQNNFEKLKNEISLSIYYLSFILIPITLFCFTFSSEIITFLFGRGSFDNESIEMTSGILRYFSIGIIVFGIRTILYNAFYSINNTKTPMINSSFSMIINIFMSLILVRFLGLNGLAIATSLSAIFCTILLYFNLQKSIGILHFDFRSYIRVVIVALTSLIITYLVYNLTGLDTKSWALIIIGILYLLIYILLSVSLKIKGTEQILNIFKRK